MNMFECAALAFQDIRTNAPANGCRAESENRVDAGCSASGGWSSARRLVEGLYGGKAIVNISQQHFGTDQLPTVEVLADDPVASSRNFTCDDGILGVQGADGAYALAYGREGESVSGALVTAAPASLCAAVVRGGELIPGAVAYLLEHGVEEGEIQWAWSCAPVIISSFDDEASCAAGREAIARDGVCSIWLRKNTDGLEALAKGYPHCRLRLHELETAKTYGAE